MRGFLLLSLGVFSFSALAADLPGSHDLDVLPRFPRAEIVDFRQAPSEERIYPLGAISRISGRLRMEGEDDASIALGITGYKGRVHINFGAELEGEFSDAKQLAAELDRQILGNYRLFAVHYLAYEMSENRDPGLAVPTAESLFGSEELEKARKEWNRRLEQCPAEQRPWLVLQYANPVLNQYRIKQQS